MSFDRKTAAEAAKPTIKCSWPKAWRVSTALHSSPRRVLRSSLDQARQLRHRSTGFAVACTIIRESESDCIYRAMVMANSDLPSPTGAKDYIKRETTLSALLPRLKLFRWAMGVRRLTGD
jgi:hypothetical protein